MEAIHTNSQKQSSKGVLLKRRSWNFHKIHRKTPVPESLFSKVAGLRTATSLKKRLWHRWFPANFVKFLRTPFFTEHLCWQLLNSATRNIKMTFLC